MADVNGMETGCVHWRPARWDVIRSGGLDVDLRDDQGHLTEAAAC